MRREETYHLLHADAWLRRLAEAGPETRDRLAAALRSIWPDAQQVFAPLAAEEELLRDGLLPRPMETLHGEWQARVRPVLEPIAGELAGGRPESRRPDAANRRLHLAPWRVHVRLPGRGRCDVVTESAIDAREARVWSELAMIRDPEIPAINLVELGVIGSVSVDDRRVEVELLPTFVGCPAIGVMQEQITERVGALGLADEVAVRLSFDPPWTSERITPAGRERLRLSGFAPPHIATFAGRGHGSSRGAGRAVGGGVPVLRLAEHDPREPVRADPVPGDLPLRRLPPAVRAIQAHLSGRPDALPFEPW